ncbi:hypothetical protein [Streptomyces orinoci]|uniref:DUF222 domain-containing protein n=1 Tax=Streptomyces orinoci TaxID=67339 RepID=A0ABV3JYD5_STRON|nr:hypothetical protein [Streptomyces orinoci]
MLSTRWSRRRARWALRRGLARIEIRLPSAHPGIGFTARIAATVMTEPPYPISVAEVTSRIRSVLRQAACDIAKDCDPADLATAADICEDHLRQVRFLPTTPRIEFHAKVTLSLLPDDQMAVAAVLAAQRRQAVADAVRLQRTKALAEELADPAAVLVRWTEQDAVDWNNPPSVEKVKAFAEALSKFRPRHGRAVEFEAVEVVREFLDTFPDLAQKRMLYGLLAASMLRAGRPEHAAKAEALLDAHSIPEPDGAS